MKFSSTCETLFALLRAALRGEGMPEVENFEAVLKEARKQTVDGLLYALPELSVTPDSRTAFLQWIGRMGALESINRTMNTHGERLSREFAKAGIRHAVMKGQTCAAYYPNPLLRRCGDIDVYIAPRHFAKACTLLEQFKFKKIDETMQHTSYEKNGLDIELHWIPQRLQWPQTHRKLQRMLAAEFDAPELTPPTLDMEGGRVCMLPPELNMVLLTAHPFTHIVNEGLGLRQVIDWMLVWEGTKAHTDVQRLYEHLRALHLMRMFRALAYICHTYLGMPEEAARILPDVPAFDNKDARRGEKVLERILETGNFGHELQFGIGTKRSCRFYRYFLHNCLRFFTLNPTEMLAWPWMKLYRAATGKNHLHE